MSFVNTTLTALVGRASSSIAELLRLSQHLPAEFNDASLAPAFAYLREPEKFEERINASSALVEADRAFLEANIEFALRAYSLFEAVVKYFADLKELIASIESGYHIQFTLDNVLADVDGKQLMCEGEFHRRRRRPPPPAAAPTPSTTHPHPQPFTSTARCCFSWRRACRGRCASGWWWRATASTARRV